MAVFCHKEPFGIDARAMRESQSAVVSPIRQMWWGSVCAVLNRLQPHRRLLLSAWWSWLSFAPIALAALWLAASERQLHPAIYWDAEQGRACVEASSCPPHAVALSPLGGAADIGDGGAASAQDRVVLDETLLSDASHYLPTYQARVDYAREHHVLHRILAAPQAVLHMSDGSMVAVEPVARGWSRTDPMLAMHVLLASIAWAAGVANLWRRRDLAHAMLALAATSYAVGMVLSGIEGSHGLAWPQGLAGPLNHIARLTVLLSFASFTGFLLCLPARHVPARLVIALPLLAGAVSVVDGLEGFPAPMWGHQAVVIGWGLAMLAAIGYQWHLSRSPLLRAFMQWLALGALLQTLRIVFIFALPESVVHQQAFVQMTLLPFKLYWLVLLVISPVLSLADGLFRRLLLWTLAALMLVLADALLLLVMQQHLALASSLMLVGIFYLPLRNWMMQTLLGHRSLRLEDHVEALYAAARAGGQSGRAHEVAWTALMRRVFEPESAEVLRRDAVQARVQEQGVALWAPLYGLPSKGVMLRYALGGRRLFTRADVDFVRHCTAILGRLIESDRAAGRARQEERERIANDLHDDLGGRLMHLANGGEDGHWRRYAQETLTEMRFITHGLARESAPVGELLADLRAEFMPRLRSARLSAQWRTSVSIEDGRRIRPEAALAIARILSEGLRNAMAHGGAAAIDVDIGELHGQWQLGVSNDGHPTDPSSWTHGLGTRSILRRAARLGGSAQWQARPGGGVVLRVCLPPTILEQWVHD